MSNNSDLRGAAQQPLGAVNRARAEAFGLLPLALAASARRWPDEGLACVRFRFWCPALRALMKSVRIAIYRSGPSGPSPRELVRSIDAPVDSAKRLTAERARRLIARSLPEFANPMVIEVDDGWQASRRLELVHAYATGAMSQPSATGRGPAGCWAALRSASGDTGVGGRCAVRVAGWAAGRGRRREDRGVRGRRGAAHEPGLSAWDGRGGRVTSSVMPSSGRLRTTAALSQAQPTSRMGVQRRDIERC